MYMSTHMSIHMSTHKDEIAKLRAYIVYATKDIKPTDIVIEVCADTHARTHACTHVRTHACTYIHKHTRMYDVYGVGGRYTRAAQSSG